METKKMKKNTLVYFYQTLSDLKNNLDTLFKELYYNQNNLNAYARDGKSVVKKSKLPDLKKLEIVKKTRERGWEITDVGKEVLKIYEKEYDDEKKLKFKEIVKKILGAYNYKGFRPYAILCKFLHNEFGKSAVKRAVVIKFFSLPINRAVEFLDTDYKLENKQIPEVKEASLPYTYVINFLKTAGFILEKEKKSFFLADNINSLLSIFFSEVNKIPKEERVYFSLVRRRWGDQVSFRKKLLEAYGNKCALTKKYCIINEKNLLEAAHIIPVSKGGAYEISNGILMTRNLHAAFDAGIFCIDNEYKLIYSKKVIEKNYLPQDKQVINLPKLKNEQPSLISLEYHRKEIFKK